MLTRIMRPREDKGFTLIELLVVVAIIGILAAVAIPVFLSQRNGARDASVKSDINGIAKVMETLYVEDNEYPLVQATLDGGNPQTSPNNALTVDVAADGASFNIVGCNLESNTPFEYDSDGGGLLATTTATCPAAVGVVLL